MQPMLRLAANMFKGNRADTLSPGKRRGDRKMIHLGTDDFDSSVVQAAWAYHTQIGVGGPRSNVPVELAAFIAGACWARQVIVAKGKDR
jgi:hypothetical protein